MAIKVKLAGVKVGGPVSTLAWLPDVDESGDLSWTQSDTTTPPESRNIKGQDGVDGVDGITPHIGANGDWYIGDEDTGKPSRGEDGADGADGADGYTPKRGVDYWTDSDKAEIVADVKKTPWSDCMMQAYGDSQTEANNKKNAPWNYKMYNAGFINSCGYIGNAVSGFTLAVNASSYGSILNIIKSASSLFPQLVVIMGGVNDVWFDSPLGDITSKSNTTVYGALKEMCEYIYEKYPRSTVVFITPTEQDNPNCVEPSTVNGTTVALVAQAIRDVAASYGCPVFDAHDLLGIYPAIAQNAALYTTAPGGTMDKLHLNDTAEEKIANGLNDFLRFVPKPNFAATAFTGVRTYGQPIYFNGCLNVPRSGAVCCVVLENVTKIEIDGADYDSIFCLKAVNGTREVPVGFFGFLQSDGSWVGVSPFGTVTPTSVSDITGDRWTFAADMRSQRDHIGNLFVAPATRPDTISAEIDGTEGKIYLDQTLVYTVPNALGLGYICTQWLINGLKGVALTINEVD